MPKSVGVTCLLVLTAVCSAALAKTALAQDFTGAVYAGIDAQQNGLVAYGRKPDGALWLTSASICLAVPEGDSTLVARSTR